MYQTYVMPRMLFSLEVLDLRKTDLKQLSDFHVDLLRRIQSLPLRTALPAVYLLVGALPLEAELHKRQLSLLFSILSSENTTLHQLVQRALGHQGLPYSGFFKRVSDTLDLYSLPTIKQLLVNTATKFTIFALSTGSQLTEINIGNTGNQIPLGLLIFLSGGVLVTCIFNIDYVYPLKN